MNSPIERRKFLARASVLTMAGIAAAVGVPAAAYMIGPSRNGGSKHEPVALGSATSAEIGTPTLFKATVQRSSGWLVTEEELAVFVKTENGRDFVAMSNVCTHLGCRVRWVEDERKFYCPCHVGIFDEDGNVLAGPPPRPLDRFDVTVEEGRLILHLGESPDVPT